MVEAEKTQQNRLIGKGEKDWYLNPDSEHSEKIDLRGEKEKDADPIKAARGESYENATDEEIEKIAAASPDEEMGYNR